MYSTSGVKIFGEDGSVLTSNNPSTSGLINGLMIQKYLNFSQLIYAFFDVGILQLPQMLGRLNNFFCFG